MICGTKILASLVCSFNEFTNLFDFHTMLNNRTAEEYQFPKKAEYKSLFIEEKSEQTILISGSIHKYFNSGTNDSFFNYSQLEYTLRSLCSSFKINLFKSKIQNLEFGVNIITPFDVDEFLQRLISYKHNRFTIEVEDNKTYYVCKNQRYWIKIYNKGKQYKLEQNVLRFEIKVKKMKQIEQIGIKYLCDLLDKNKLIQLGVMLEEAFDDILYTDRSINEDQLTDKQQLILAHGNNPEFWESRTKNQRHKKKIEFKKLLSSHGTETYFPIVKKLIPEIWDQLLNNKIGDVLTDFDNLQEIEQKGHFNQYSKLLIRPTPQNEVKRYCLTCGREITHQKTDSKFCSEKTFGPQVKKCRNTDSNPRNNFKRKINKIFAVPQLFDSSQFLRLTPEQRNWIEL